MRASMLSFWVALTAVSLGAPALAQAPAAKEPGASAKPAAGDDALSPSTLPKARQGVKETGTNRVDELSPDEARRLERVRAKAAGAKPQPAQSVKVKEAAKPQPTAPERAAEKSEPAAKSPAPEIKAPVAPKEVARSPAADAEPASPGRVPSTRAPRQASRQASHHTHRQPREAYADPDARRYRRWDYPPPRRGWPEVAERAPRVGDVVPYGAPLYPPPPGYGRGYLRYPDDGGYPPPGYGRRWWP